MRESSPGAQTAPATLTLLPSGWQAPVAPGQSLLEAAQAAGIHLPRSCRNGTCRACLCQLEAGEVHWRVDWPGVLAEERAQGWILPCVAETWGDVRLIQPRARRLLPPSGDTRTP
ncbi:2Fe-2S iron-sulfur cluster-binding protein [Ideonella livida]|uniref:2Fe-2S iron-sulfur cluster binding domain-containing protein n=1 Tax=Ideonella livida TaxID=2707176 RepID=A0A7C9TMH2_9BURK|nr:2Fe-2S iron-sulfur cluster-binding protein [Ideonella livida]NDY92625.1 2Fe-2S iron-sulfur cluster binding domain-containing protein [Ideonella livida]